MLSKLVRIKLYSFSGRSRSCTLVLSYLIHKNKYTYENAIK